MREPDWALAESLYRERASLDVIVREANLPSLGALKKRIQRKGWRTTRNHAREVLEREGIQVKSEILRDVVLTECLRDAEIVQQNPPRNMGQSFRRQKLISSIATNGEKAGAWSSGQPEKPLVSITHLSMAVQWADDPVRQGSKIPETAVEYGPNGEIIETPYAEWCAKNGKPLPAPAIDVSDVSEQSQTDLNERP